jgi:hypothetical protein
MSPKTMDARKRLSVFNRICSSLRNQSPRNQGQIAALQQEIDALRKILGYPTHEHELTTVLTSSISISSSPLTPGEIQGTARWVRLMGYEGD